MFSQTCNTVVKYTPFCVTVIRPDDGWYFLPKHVALFLPNATFICTEKSATGACHATWKFFFHFGIAYVSCSSLLMFFSSWQVFRVMKRKVCCRFQLNMTWQLAWSVILDWCFYYRLSSKLFFSPLQKRPL